MEPGGGGAVGGGLCQDGAGGSTMQDAVGGDRVWGESWSPGVGAAASDFWPG